MDILDVLLKAKHEAEREFQRPPVGSPENPFKLLVPAWVEAKAKAEGTTPQAIVNELYPLTTITVEILQEF